MVTIYILKCEDDKYYVGKIASNVWKRIKQHFDGKGAKWTQKYKPVDILDIRRGMTDRHGKYTSNESQSPKREFTEEEKKKVTFDLQPEEEKEQPDSGGE